MSKKIILLFALSFIGKMYALCQVIDTSEYLAGNKNFNLIIAADRGYETEIKRLLKLGADPNSTTYDGATPLMFAAQRGHNDVVEILLQNGADPDKIPNDGISALTSAVMFDRLETSEIIIREGGNVDVRDKNGATPLMYSTALGFYNMADMLIYYGADMEARDRNGNTPLIIAVYTKNIDIINLLIEKGVKLDVADDEGITPLILAAQQGDSVIFQKLVDFGANIHHESNDGITPLIAAVNNNHPKIVQILLDNRVDINQTPQNGKSAVTLATTFNRTEIKKMFESQGAKSIIKPNINYLLIGAETSFNADDLFTNFHIGLREEKFHIGLQAGFSFRPFKQPELSELYENVYYQYYTQRYLAFARLNREFQIYRSSPYNAFGIKPAISLSYEFGNYEGSKLKPDNRIYYIPEALIYFQFHAVNFNFGYQYHDLKLENISPHRFVISLSYGFNLSRQMSRTKKIQWIENTLKYE